MGKSALKVGGACLNQTPLDWDNNFENIVQAIDLAKKNDVDIICLPELCITGYGCEDLFLSPWVAEKAINIFFEIIPYTQKIGVSIGLPLWYEGELYNATGFISSGKLQGFYLKQQLAKTGVHYEPRWFSAWTPQKVSVIKLHGECFPIGHFVAHHKCFSIGFEICEDAWLPHRPASLLTEKTDIILNPSASHFSFQKAQFRKELVVNSSKQFDCVYVYANLLGNEAGRLIYDGDIIIAQKGQLIAYHQRLSFDDCQILSTSIDIENSENSIKNIAPSMSSLNEEFTQVASLALFDYLRKSKSKRFVLSLSGGADSGSIAILISEMVKRGIKELGGKEFVKKIGSTEKPNNLLDDLLVTAYQRSENSSEASFFSAKKIADEIGATFYDWDIDQAVKNFTSTIETALSSQLTWKENDIALQNIQARSRSPFVWLLTNVSDALLLTTSNRSEADVGYATMDGDTSGSIAPIAGVSKQFILNWLVFAEKELGYACLGDVNKLSPSAELRPKNKNQSDEEDLMPYDVLMKIEEEAVLHRKSPTQVFDALKISYDEDLLKTWIKKFFRSLATSQWKRSRYAPSFHYDVFSVDPYSWYRFPILSGGFKKELDAL